MNKKERIIKGIAHLIMLPYYLVVVLISMFIILCCAFVWPSYWASHTVRNYYAEDFFMFIQFFLHKLWNQVL